MSKLSRKSGFNPRHLYKMAIGDGGDFVHQHQELTFWLGAISVQWAGLEAATFQLFFACMGTDIVRAETMFYSHRNSRARRELALASFSKTRKSKEQTAELAGIIGRIGKLAERRNDLIHHAWATDAKGKRPHRFGVDIQVAPAPEHPKKIKELFGEIDGVTVELNAFVRKHLYKLPQAAAAATTAAEA